MRRKKKIFPKRKGVLVRIHSRFDNSVGEYKTFRARRAAYLWAQTMVDKYKHTSGVEARIYHLKDVVKPNFGSYRAARVKDL